MEDQLKALLGKLLQTEHLNVPERKLLLAGKAPAIFLVEIICEFLKKDGRFPLKHNLEKDFSGCLIIQDKGQFHLYEKDEIGYLRYTAKENLFETAEQAAKAYLQKSYQNNIDGIPINWI